MPFSHLPPHRLQGRPRTSRTAVARAAKRVKLLVTDVDGVLTDGGLHYDHDGAIHKRFDVQDGLGIKAAQGLGLEVAVITGLNSEAVRTRVEELGIAHYVAGRVEKVSALEAICRDVGVSFCETAYIGDDWVDLAPMAVVGLPLAVPNAQPETLRQALHVLARPGGRGAVREAIRFILFCQGRLQDETARWFAGVGLR